MKKRHEKKLIENFFKVASGYCEHEHNDLDKVVWYLKRCAYHWYDYPSSINYDDCDFMERLYYCSDRIGPARARAILKLLPKYLEELNAIKHE